MVPDRPWPQALHQLAELVERVSGNVVPENFLPFLAEVARERQIAHRLHDLEEYVRALAGGRFPDEWQKLLPAITIKESYLFRTPQHFQMLSDHIIPELVRARAATRSLRFWSAGCARGEEPTTLAIVLSEHQLLAGWSWSILATDVDHEALAQARLGLFSQRAVASVSEQIKAQYFQKQGELWALSLQVSKKIDYKPLNLVADLYPPYVSSFDVIFLRNVLIYFRLESQRRVLDRIADFLAEDGYLFLGPAETVWQLSEKFEPVDYGACFAYRKRRAAPAGQSPPMPKPRQVKPATSMGKTSPTVAPPQPPPPQPPPLPQPLSSPLPATTTDPLAEIVALVVGGNLERAQSQLRDILRANPADPQAHALEGYICEVLGESQAAICGFRAALYLEPALFQARLLLAHCLRRLGETSRARAEYRHLLTQLAASQGKELDRLGELPLPSAEQAARQAKAALEGLSYGLK